MFGLNDAESTNALDLLKRDHKEVDDLFQHFEDAKEDGNRKLRGEIAAQICAALTVHATMEEEIFYPALRKNATDVKDLVDEAAVEHQTLKDIIERLQAAPTSDPLFDAGVKVLSEYVKHHVKEEEHEIFPKAKGSDIDLDQLGERMAQRKSELTAAMAAPGARSRKRSNGKGTSVRKP